MYIARTFRVSFRCYCDPEGYNGFNIALCLLNKLPTDNPNFLTYIKPPHNESGNYTYDFNDVLLNSEKKYEVWVQAISYGRDSMWRSAGGLEVPDDGIGTIGSGVADPEAVKQAVQNGLDNGEINIDGSKTDITNINGLNISDGTIAANSINVNDLVVNGLATFNGDAWVKGDMVVQSDLRIHGNQIVDGNVWIKSNLEVDGATMLKSALTVMGPTHIKNMLEVDGTLTVHGNQIIDGDSWIKGKLEADGATILKDSLTVMGPAHIKDMLEVDGTLKVKGDQIINGNSWIKSNLEVDGATMLKSALTVMGPAHIKDMLEVDGTLTVHGNQIIDGDSWIKGKLEADGATILKDSLNVIGDTWLQNMLTVSGKAWISGVAIINGSISGESLAVNSVSAAHINSDDVITNFLQANSAWIKGNMYVEGTIEGKHLRVETLGAKLAEITEAYIGGVHIKDNSVKAQNIDSYDLASNGLASLNVAFVDEQHVKYGIIDALHIKQSSINNTHIKDGVIDMAKIADVIQSANYVENESGWQIKKAGTAEFCGGVKIANWIVGPGALKSSETGGRIELSSNKSRVSILSDDNSTKVAIGYLDGLQRLNENGEHIQGEEYGESDYGLYVSPGNKLNIVGNSEFSKGEWRVKSDGAYIVENAIGDTVIKLGTVSAETGLFNFDKFGNILSAVTDKRVEIGNIKSGSGMLYDSEGLKIVGNIRITQPLDTSGISVPEPHNVGYVLL